MAVVATATLRGTVFPAPGIPGTLRGTVDAPGEPATLMGTVSRAVITSEEGPATRYAWEVYLGSDWIPAEDLVGPLEVEESLDSVTMTWSFGVAGRRYSIHATETSWTRAWCEVWCSVGPVGGALRRWRRAAGLVLTCDQEEGPEPVVRIRCADLSILYERAEVCYELPPLSGIPRGEVAAEIAAGVGMFDTDIPPGQPYLKPLVADSRRVFELLQAFGEPEDWHWRITPEGVLEAYTAAVKREPQEPDAVWSSEPGSCNVASLTCSPPAEVPSRYVARGESIVRTDEAGIKTTLTRTVLRSLYSPKVADLIQLADGTQIPAGYVSEPESLRVTSILEDETQELGGRVIRQTTREFGWWNPAAAKLRTPDGGSPAGPVEEGYWWAQAYIDLDGNYRAWPREAFVQVGERRETPVYDAEGTLLRRRTEELRWYRRPMGVRNSMSETLNVAGAGVGDDDNSYYPVERALSALLRIEEFGLAEVTEVSYEYSATGAAQREVQETWRYQSPRTAVEGTPWFVRYDGTGQQDLLANLTLVARKTTVNIVSESGGLAGKVEDVAALAAPKKVNGAHDWGDFKSNAVAEELRTVRRETTQYNVLSELAYEEIVRSSAEETPQRRIVPGRPPLPRYRSSPWVSYSQAPLETILEDGTLADWFGHQAEVVSQEFLQDLPEARAWLARRLSRRLSRVHQVVRPRTEIRPGSTVLLIDPRQLVSGRCLLTRLREIWTLGPRTEVLGTYTLEEPL